MPEQQTVNPPVNSNSGSSSSQDTNQSTPKVDDTIDELLQGEEKKKKKKNFIDSALEAAKRRSMALRGISQKDLEEGRTPESVKHLYSITPEILLNPNAAMDFVTKGGEFLKNEQQNDGGIIYEGMKVHSGKSVPLTKEQISKGYIKGSTIYEQKYQISHNDPTYIKDYFFRTGKHPAQDPNSDWTDDERREGKQSWQMEEFHKDWEAKRAREKADPAIMEAEEWLKSDEGRKAKKDLRDSYQGKVDALLDDKEKNKYEHDKRSSGDYYDDYRKLRQEETDAVKRLKSDRANQHESRIGKEGVPAKEGRIQPGIRGGGVEAGSPDDAGQEELRQRVIDASQNATQTVHNNVSQQKEKQMYQDAVNRAASGPVADGPANTNIKLPRGEHQAPVEEPPAEIMQDLSNQRQDNRDVDAVIAPATAGFISGPPAPATVEPEPWGLQEWGLTVGGAELARRGFKKYHPRFSTKADAPDAPKDKKGPKVRPAGGTKWDPRNWRKGGRPEVFPDGTLNPSGKPGPPVEGVPVQPRGHVSPEWSGGDAPVPELTPEQIAQQQRHAAGVERQTATTTEHDPQAVDDVERSTFEAEAEWNRQNEIDNLERSQWEKERLAAAERKAAEERPLSAEAQKKFDDDQVKLLNEGKEPGSKVTDAEAEFDRKYAQGDLFDDAHNKKMIDAIQGPDDLDHLLNEINEKDVKPKGSDGKPAPSADKPTLLHSAAGKPGPQGYDIAGLRKLEKSLGMDNKTLIDSIDKKLAGLGNPNTAQETVKVQITGKDGKTFEIEIGPDVPKGQSGGRPKTIRTYKEIRMGSMGANITKEDIMAAAKGVKNATTKVRNVINQNPGSAKAGFLLSLLALAGSSVDDSWDWGDLINSDAWANADIGGAFYDAASGAVGGFENYNPSTVVGGFNRNLPLEISRGFKDMSQTLLVNPLVSMQQGMGGRRVDSEGLKASAENRRIPTPSSSGYGTPMAR